MSDPNAAATAAAAAAATTASAQQNQGVAGRPKLPTIEKARMKQMLDEPEVQQELSKLVGGNASSLQAIVGILKAMASSSDINSDPQMLELLKNPHQGFRNKIGEALELLKEIYFMREPRNAGASGPNGAPAVPSAPLVPVPAPTPEQLRGKGDALGGTENQNYQSIHDGAFKEYNPIPWPGVGSGPRPTLSGGLFNGYIDGTPASLARPPQDSSIFIPDVRHSSLRKTPGQDAVRKRIQELATTIDPGVKVDSEAETLLLEIADEFIESVTNFACRLAKHRGSESLEIKDLQLHLEMNHNIRIPGFSNEPPIPQGNIAIATGAASTSTGAGGSGGGAPAGGNRKADASTAGASGAGGGGGPKRSARLAAVQQAKRESRLL